MVFFFFVVYVLYLWWFYKKYFRKGCESGVECYIKVMVFDYVLFFIYGGLMVIGVRFVVYGGRNIVEVFGVVEYVIGVIIVVIGIFLFEMMNVFYGVIRECGSISVGNIIGVNIMNVFVVFGLVLLIRLILIGVLILIIVFVFMVMFLMIVELKCFGGFDRRIGFYFLIFYVVYFVLLFLGVKF